MIHTRLQDCLKTGSRCAQQSLRSTSYSLVIPWSLLLFIFFVYSMHRRYASRHTIIQARLQDCLKTGSRYAQQSLRSTSYSLVIPWSLQLFSRKHVSLYISAISFLIMYRDTIGLEETRRHCCLSNATTQYHKILQIGLEETRRHCCLSNATTQYHKLLQSTTLLLLSTTAFFLLLLVQQCRTESHINFLFLGYPLVASPV
jgi:hypothetical protein